MSEDGTRAERVDALASRIFDAAVSMHGDYAAAGSVQDIRNCVEMAADAALASLRQAARLLSAMGADGETRLAAADGGQGVAPLSTQMPTAAVPDAFLPATSVPSQEDRLRQLMRTWIGDELMVAPGCELTMEEIGGQFDAAMIHRDVRVQRPCHQILEQELMSVFRRQGVQLEVGGKRVVRGVAWK